MPSYLTLQSNFTASCLEATNQQEPFNSKAYELFTQQYSANSAYRNYCQKLGKNLNNITRWEDIPALTTDVFKIPDIPIISFPSEHISRTFTTSGTTQDIKGQHHFPTLDTYERSIIACWQQLELPDAERPTQFIFLTPKPEDAPQSSLSHMMGVIDDQYATGSQTSPNSIWPIDQTGEMDIESIISTIKNSSESSNQPVAILGTALAFLYLFEKLADSPTPITLPASSWAMETGGYKGTKRHLEKKDLYALFEQHLGLTSDQVINEYSMTELSSQFYTTGLDDAHQGPSWTRIRVIDPLTDEEALDGQPGHLVIYDLMNIHSVMAIRTQDIAIATGKNSFILLGRDPSAIPRGCSRAADATLRS